nr:MULTISPECIES: mycothiol conjugate amidase Mca [unclassified Corynebacterium]
MRLLAIHAHPDDESSKGAATMARYAAEGHRVMVVTCTGGERGDILNPAMDRPGIRERIDEVRREEMAEAARALGIEHRWLGYVDSGLPEGDPLPPLPEGCFARESGEDIAAELVEIIRDFRPHVIITYDENGGYPHPDHLKVHEASMIAWAKAGDPAVVTTARDTGRNQEPWEPLKLYYTHGFVYERIKAFHDLLVERGQESPYERMLGFMQDSEDIMARVTTQVPCADYFEARAAALRAHATQVDPRGGFLVIDAQEQARLWPTEEFELAATRVATTLPEGDLFAGVAGDGGLD